MELSCGPQLSLHLGPYLVCDSSIIIYSAGGGTLINAHYSFLAAHSCTGASRMCRGEPLSLSSQSLKSWLCGAVNKKARVNEESSRQGLEFSNRFHPVLS